MRRTSHNLRTALDLFRVLLPLLPILLPVEVRPQEFLNDRQGSRPLEIGLGQDTLVLASAGWRLLDRARLYHLNEEYDRALASLDSLARDTTAQDGSLVIARRELTAYVLAAAGEFEQAFDTLHLLLISQARLREREEARLQQEVSILQDSLHLLGSEMERSLVEERQRHEQETGRITLIGGLALVCALTILLLLFISGHRSRKRLRRYAAQADHAREEQKTIAPVTVQATAPPAANTAPADPMHAQHVLMHTTHAARVLDRNDQLRAGMYLQAFNRYLKMLAEEEGKALMPLSKLILLIRQHLKLTSLRSEKRFHYSVDVDRALAPDTTLGPGRLLLAVIMRLTVQLERLPEPAIAVELLPMEGGDHAQCVITITSDPATTTAIRELVFARLDPTLSVLEESDPSAAAGKVRWRINW